MVHMYTYCPKVLATAVICLYLHNNLINYLGIRGDLIAHRYIFGMAYRLKHFTWKKYGLRCTFLMHPIFNSLIYSIATRFHAWECKLDMIMSEFHIWAIEICAKLSSQWAWQGWDFHRSVYKSSQIWPNSEICQAHCKLNFVQISMAQIWNSLRIMSSLHFQTWGLIAIEYLRDLKMGCIRNVCQEPYFFMWRVFTYIQSQRYTYELSNHLLHLRNSWSCCGDIRKLQLLQNLWIWQYYVHHGKQQA